MTTFRKLPTHRPTRSAATWRSAGQREAAGQQGVTCIVGRARRACKRPGAGTVAGARATTVTAARLDRLPELEDRKVHGDHEAADQRRPRTTMIIGSSRLDSAPRHRRPRVRRSRQPCPAWRRATRIPRRSASSAAPCSGTALVLVMALVRLVPVLTSVWIFLVPAAIHVVAGRAAHRIERLHQRHARGEHRGQGARPARDRRLFDDRGRTPAA